MQGLQRAEDCLRPSENVKPRTAFNFLESRGAAALSAAGTGQGRAGQDKVPPPRPRSPPAGPGQGKQGRVGQKIWAEVPGRDGQRRREAGRVRGCQPRLSFASLSSQYPPSNRRQLISLSFSSQQRSDTFLEIKQTRD